MLFDGKCQQRHVQIFSTRRNNVALNDPNVPILNFRIDPPRWRQEPGQEVGETRLAQTELLLKSEYSHSFRCGTLRCFTAFCGG